MSMNIYVYRYKPKAREHSAEEQNHHIYWMKCLTIVWVNMLLPDMCVWMSERTSMCASVRMERANEDIE